MRYKSFLNPILAALIMLTSQFACQSVTLDQQTTPTPAPEVSTATSQSQPEIASDPGDISQLSDDEIKAGIQDSLNQFADAYTNNTPDVLETVVDQTNKPFRRIVRNRFDEYQQSYAGGQNTFTYTLLDIKRREFGYVIAHFETAGGYEADWPFRLLDGHWVLTEPTVEQVGNPVITETEHFTFTTYPWADDVNQKIMDMMETARNNVEDVLGKVPDEKANVKIMPIYGLSPYNPMNAIALYSKDQGPFKNVIEVYAPNSYAYSFYDPTLGWDGELQSTLTHEYTHMTHTLSFGQAGRLSDWMSEGLAEYVAGAGEENSYYACDAMRSGTLIPIVDDSNTANKQDLMHMYTLEKNFGLSYDFATSLVYFTVDTHGGLDGFWKLANALDDTSDFKEAVEKSFGISYDDYNNEWQAWLKKHC